jgi:hypothetical protein
MEMATKASCGVIVTLIMRTKRSSNIRFTKEIKKTPAKMNLLLCKTKVGSFAVPLSMFRRRGEIL